VAVNPANGRVRSAAGHLDGFGLARRIGEVATEQERLLQYATEPRVDLSVEVVKAEMWNPRTPGIDVGAEQSVPDRQHDAEVAVRFHAQIGVMGRVHRRRHDYVAEHAV
jgi:hypothetical protein